MFTNKRTAMSLVLAAGLFAGFGAATSDASACGGAWVEYIEVDHRIQGIAQAEKQFNKGEVDAAAASVIRMMPHVATLKAKKSKLVERGQRILAVALARNDGALPVSKEVPGYAQGTWMGKSEKDRDTNLEWAVGTLRSVNEIKKDDPAAQTDLAEAMSKVEKYQSEAREVLERLAKKDLIATPEGYAALAKLRSKAGDSAGKKLAMQRCEAMAKTATVCKVQG
jgi:hypothetical protein